jgi:hypothetical protein
MCKTWHLDILKCRSHFWVQFCSSSISSWILALFDMLNILVIRQEYRSKTSYTLRWGKKKHNPRGTHEQNTAENTSTVSAHKWTHYTFLARQWTTGFVGKQRWRMGVLFAPSTNITRHANWHNKGFNAYSKCWKLLEREYNKLWVAQNPRACRSWAS